MALPQAAFQMNLLACDTEEVWCTSEYTFETCVLQLQVPSSCLQTITEGRASKKGLVIVEIVVLFENNTNNRFTEVVDAVQVQALH